MISNYVDCSLKGVIIMLVIFVFFCIFLNYVIKNYYEETVQQYGETSVTGFIGLVAVLMTILLAVIYKRYTEGSQKFLQDPFYLDPNAVRSN